MNQYKNNFAVLVNNLTETEDLERYILHDEINNLREEKTELLKKKLGTRSKTWCYRIISKTMANVSVTLEFLGMCF